MAPRRSTTRGFARTASLVQDRIRRVSEQRGFAETRVLTHWAEIVGPDIAAIARPVDVSFARNGFGATLTLLTTGPQAPVLEMQKEQIRTRINSVYGYNAIARIRVTQTAPTGFAEGQAQFAARAPAAPAVPDPQTRAAAEGYAAPVGDQTLRQALETLGQHVLSRKH